MTYRFDPNETFIAVEVVMVGPKAFGKTIFALDTGATQTGIDEVVILAKKYGIATPYTSGETVLGTVGVIGPTRMNYQRIIPLVNFTAQVLSKALGEE